jgi:hypothetical protein
MDSDARSNIALLVSFGSLLVSAAGFVVNTFRDRPRLKVTSNLWHDDNGDPYKIAVNVVNRGRRPVILRLIGGYDRKGEWDGTYLDHEKGGVRLGEHEHKQFQLDKEEVVMTSMDGPKTPTMSCGSRTR